ncbi:MAG: hypothetical protein ACK55I_49725, partial [bacterium]
AVEAAGAGTRRIVEAAVDRLDDAGIHVLHTRRQRGAAGVGDDPRVAAVRSGEPEFAPRLHSVADALAAVGGGAADGKRERGGRGRDRSRGRDGHEAAGRLGTRAARQG